MTELKRVGALEIHQDLQHERNEWVIERVGWVVMALILVAALLGLFGGGLLSQAHAGRAGDPIQVDYDRFERVSSLSEVRVLVAPAAVRDGQVRLQLDRTWAQALGVQPGSPEPSSQELGSDKITYVYDATLGAPSEIVLSLDPGHMGSRPGHIGLSGASPLPIRQFVYP